jgi:RHS repeat-associated protein
MEVDNEVKGNGNSYTTQFRQYDPRLGRWLSLDPVVQSHQSPYSSFDNNPVLYNDIDGRYRKNQADRMAKRARKNGYSAVVKHNEGSGKKDYYISYSKRGDKDKGTYHLTRQVEGKFKGIMKGGGHYSPDVTQEQIVARIHESKRIPSIVDELTNPVTQGVNLIENGKVVVSGTDFQGVERSRWAAAGYIVLEFTPFLLSKTGRIVKASKILFRSGDDVISKTDEVVDLATTVAKGKSSVQFGETAEQIEHAFRHTDGMGISRKVVQDAISKHLPSVADDIAIGASKKSTISAGGQKIVYSAYKLPDGTINVRRITATGKKIK